MSEVGTWSWGNESFGLGTQRDPEDPEGPGASALIGKAQSHTVSKTEPLARRKWVVILGEEIEAFSVTDSVTKFGAYMKLLRYQTPLTPRCIQEGSEESWGANGLQNDRGGA